MIRFTESEISEMRMMYKQAKYPAKQIGILADMYVCTKREIIQALDMPVKKRQYIKWTPKLDEWLLELQSDGKSAREIAELIGTTEERIYRRSLKLRAEAKNPPAAQEAASGNKINTFLV